MFIYALIPAEAYLTLTLALFEFNFLVILPFNLLYGAVSSLKNYR